MEWWWELWDGQTEPSTSHAHPCHLPAPCFACLTDLGSFWRQEQLDYSSQPGTQWVGQADRKLVLVPSSAIIVVPDSACLYTLPPTGQFPDCYSCPTCHPPRTLFFCLYRYTYNYPRHSGGWEGGQETGTDLGQWGEPPATWCQPGRLVGWVGILEQVTVVIVSGDLGVGLAWGMGMAGSWAVPYIPRLVPSIPIH